MIEHFALRFSVAYQKFCRGILELFLLEKEHRAKDISQRVLSEQRKKFIAEDTLAPILKEITFLEFPANLRAKANKLYVKLIDPGSRTWTAELLYDAYLDLRGEIDSELDKHKFFCLPPDAELNNERLFGDEVYKQLKTARQEIKEAGNAFAIELYTACVFHLMRVAEHGLRIMAKSMKVSIQDHGKSVPIQYGDWNKVITGIHNKIAAVRPAASDAKKEARLDYYSDGLERCSAMKELYRNPVSHARARYTKGKALDAMERVRNFMQFLARRRPR